MKRELKPKVNGMIELMKEHFNAKGIIISGSRSVGDYLENSDWDVYLFTNKPKPRNYQKIISSIESVLGSDLDLYYEKANQKFSYEHFGLKLRFSEVVYDDNGKITKLWNDAQKFYKKGPKKWTKEFALGRINKVQRYESKFKDLLKEKDEFNLFRRLCWHFDENTINWWYGVRREWPLRGQQAFDDIKKRDPIFYKSLKKIVSDNKKEDKVKAFRKLHKHFFESKEYQRLVK